MVVQRRVCDVSHADGALLFFRVRLERQTRNGILTDILGRLKAASWNLHRQPRLRGSHLLVEQLDALSNLRRVHHGYRVPVRRGDAYQVTRVPWCPSFAAGRRAACMQSIAITLWRNKKTRQHISMHTHTHTRANTHTHTHTTTKSYRYLRATSLRTQCWSWTSSFAASATRSVQVPGKGVRNCVAVHKTWQQAQDTI